MDDLGRRRYLGRWTEDQSLVIGLTAHSALVRHLTTVDDFVLKGLLLD